jgi:hypothetical protein
MRVCRIPLQSDAKSRTGPTTNPVGRMRVEEARGTRAGTVVMGATSGGALEKEGRGDIQTAETKGKKGDPREYEVYVFGVTRLFNDQRDSIPPTPAAASATRLLH